MLPPPLPLAAQRCLGVLAAPAVLDPRAAVVAQA